MSNQTETVSFSSLKEHAEDIENEFAQGNISGEQRDELLADNSSARTWLRGRYLVAAVIAAFIGYLALSSSGPSPRAASMQQLSHNE